MTSLPAIVLLLALTILLLRPESLPSVVMKGLAEDHPRYTACTLVTVLAIVIFIGHLSTDQLQEVDQAGYAEVWYMAQTNAGVREMARNSISDGHISQSELQSLRTTYRRTPDLAAAREGVRRELSN